jgi:hypothetical protein
MYIDQHNPNRVDLSEGLCGSTTLSLGRRLHNDGAIMHNILQYTLLYNDVKPRDCGAKMRLLALALKPGGVKAWTGKRYPRITRYHSHAAELQELPAYVCRA